LRTEFQVARGTVEEKRLNQSRISWFCVDALGVEARCLAVALALEVIIPIVLEAFGDLYEAVEDDQS
jgi:hypothetical protein